MKRIAAISLLILALLGLAPLGADATVHDGLGINLALELAASPTRLTSPLKPAATCLADQPLMPDGVVHYENRWKKSSVKVCWRMNRRDSLPKEFKSPDFKFLLETHRSAIPPEWIRLLVQEAVTTEFKRDRVGIEFTGWELCKKNDGSDVRIYFGESDVPPDDIQSFAGFSAVGSAMSDEVKNLVGDGPPYVYLKVGARAPDDTNRKIVRSLALHEFGHLAGLWHEDPDLNLAILSNPKESAFQPIPADRSRVSVVDLESIMDRRNFTFEKAKQGLSAGDVHALRCLYVYDEETRKERCHPGAPIPNES